MATRKVLMTFEEDLLARVDEVAEERGLTRSAYVGELIAMFLPGFRSAERRRAFARLARFSAGHARPAAEGRPGDLIREMRDEQTRRDTDRDRR